MRALVIARRIAIPLCIIILIAGCQKIGLSGVKNQLVGDWAEVRLPPGCKVKQIASEESAGVAILCDDGRVFH